MDKKPGLTKLGINLKWCQLKIKQIKTKTSYYFIRGCEVLPKLADYLVPHVLAEHKNRHAKHHYLQKLQTINASLPLIDSFLFFILLPIVFLGLLFVAVQFHPLPVDRVNSSQFFTNTSEVPSISAISTAPELNVSPVSFAPASSKPTKSSISNNQLEYVAAIIGKSIYTAGAKVGLSKKMVGQFVSIFNSEVNFAKDVHAGDRMIVLYKKNVPVVTTKTVSVRVRSKRSHHRSLKTKTVQSTSLTTQIVAAELITRKKSYRAIRFTDANNHTDYYDPHGVSYQPAFVRAPFKYTRISSRFTYHRWQPILHIFRAHLGVDFVGPMGTPVKATSDGRIAFMGWQNGYGNAVLVQHDSKYSSFYAHLEKFPQGEHVGTLVHQGQVIGFLGMTGLATGPHVHYEFRIYGVQHDPLSVTFPHAAISGRQDRAKFFMLAKKLLASLDGKFPHYAAQNLPSEAKDTA